MEEPKTHEPKEHKEHEIGKVEHFFSNINVAAITLSGTLKVGDTIHIKGANTDFTEKITSMQIDRKDVHEAHAGDDIGVKVKERVREHDVVYKV